MSEAKRELKILIYGTLREGEHNFHLLPAKKGSFRTITLKGLRMHHLGGFPGVVRGNDDDETVAELWTFNLEKKEYEDTINGLDRLEGHPRFYTRVEHKIPDSDEAAWIYLFNHLKGHEPKIVDWRREKDV